MSYVTNLILAFDIMEDEEERIAEINDWLHEHARGQQILEPERYGGSKCLEVPTYIGAFNYLDLDGFMRQLRTLRWRYPEYVRVMVAEQEDATYRMLEPAHGFVCPLYAP